tara:strand:+ start:437 stop:2560 length:2124 start_codon:yes stop_codon:yes gene_type:complete
MADTLKLRGGTTTQNASFTGADREVTVDTTKKTLVVHDGTNAGGTPLMREEGNSGSQTSSVKFATSGTDAIAIDSNQKVLQGHASARAVGAGDLNCMYQIEGTGATTGLSITRNNSSATTSPKLVFGKSAGSSTGSNNAVSENHVLGEIRFSGADGTDLENYSASIVGLVDGGVSGNQVPGRLEFRTGTTTDASVKMTIDKDGNCGIGTTIPSARLHVNGTTNGLQARFGGAGTGLGILCFQKTNNNALVTFEAQDTTHGELNFKTAGQNALRIDSSQRIGIGTTNPSSHSKLDVAGKINLSGTDTAFVSSSQPLIYRSGSDAGSYPFNNFGHLVLQSRGDGSNRDIIFATGASGANMTVIKDNGNVGIGTTNVSSILHIAEDEPELTIERLGDHSTTAGPLMQFKGRGSNATMYNLAKIDAVAKSGANNAGHLRFYTNNEGTQNVGMIITSDGNCGIGTTDPSSAKLQIHGTGSPAAQLLRLVNTQHDTNADSAAQLKFGITNSLGERNCRIEAKEEGANVNAVGLDFYTNSSASTDGETRKMRIDGAGRIFLSTNTNATGGGSAGLFASGSQLQCFRGNQGDYIVFKTTSDSIIGTIRNNSDTSTQYNTSGSDRALKKNFESWNENVLNLFKNINPQKFNFIHQNDGADKSKGFVAQDMVGSFPEAYTKGEEDDAKYYFNPSGMVVYLMKAIQELQAKVETLEAA